MYLPAAVLAGPTGYRIAASSNYSRGDHWKIKRDFTFFVILDAIRIESKKFFRDDDLMHSSSNVKLLIGKQENQKRYSWDAVSGTGKMNTKEYSALPCDRPKAESTAPFSQTGKMKKIVGYECEVVQRDIKGMHEAACVSRTFENELRSIVATLKDGWNSGAFFEAPGFGLALEFESTTTGDQTIGKPETKYGFVVSEIRKETLERSLFRLPKGYKVKQNLPNDHVDIGTP